MKENERTLTEEDAPQDPIFFKIPSRKVVMREFKLNRKWLLGTIGAYVLYIVIFAIFAVAFENNWSFIRALYFTVLSTLTGGYGDLTLTTAGKLLLCINSFAGLVLLGLILAVVAMSLQAEEGSVQVNIAHLENLKPAPIAENSKDPEVVKRKAVEGLVAFTELLKGNNKNERIKNGFMDITIHKDSDNETDDEISRIDISIRIRN